jgi:hypothetical protein
VLIDCEQVLFPVDLIDNGRPKYWNLQSSSCKRLNLRRFLFIMRWK